MANYYDANLTSSPVTFGTGTASPVTVPADEILRAANPAGSNPTTPAFTINGLASIVQFITGTHPDYPAIALPVQTPGSTAVSVVINGTGAQAPE